MRTPHHSTDADVMNPSTKPVRRHFLTRAAFWRNLALGAGIPLTALTGLVVGWFSIHFQFFGDTADTDDYEMALGGYGAAAVALLLGALAAWRWHAPRWQVHLALVSGAMLVLLGAAALSEMATAEPGWGLNGWIDGAGGVLGCPWTWPLVVLAVWGVFGRFARHFLAVRA